MGTPRGCRLPQASPGFRLLACVLPAALVAVPCSAQETFCDPGDTEVRSLRFTGNNSFGDADLEIRIVTTESSSLYRFARVLGTKRCLDKRQLPLDVLRLTTFYRERGFRSASISLDTTRVATNALNVVFHIVEGPPILIDALSVRGTESVVEAAREPLVVSFGTGDRFDRLLLEVEAERLASALRNNGYPRGEVAFSYELSPDSSRATVDLDVRPGPLTRISSILIRIQKDSSRMDRAPAISEQTVRKLLGFQEGDLVSARRLLDAQRNLFQTDAYRNVQIRPAPDSLQPAADSLMVIQAVLVEGHMRDLRAGIGWGTLDCFRTLITYTDRSFFGDARRMELGGRFSKIGIGYPLNGAEGLCRKEAREDIYGDTLNFRIGLNVRQPGLFGLGPREALALSIYTEQRSEYLAYFRSVPLGFSASVSRNLRDDEAVALPLTFTYALEYGRTDAQPAIYCALFNLCGEEERDRIRQRERLAVASVGLLRDSRDFVLDPSLGSALQLDWRHASKSILSDPSLQFNSLIGDYRRYWSLGGGIVLSARIRGGAVLGRQLRLAIPSDGGGSTVLRVNGYVPPAERMYAGGPSSVRGFRFNELGPEVYIVSSYDTVAGPGDTVFFRARNEVRPDRAVPTGGNSMIVANVEARLPSPFLRSLIRYAIFVDAGEVWNRGRTVGAAEAKFDGIKITPGVGLRLLSPVGPIRIDVGYNPYNRTSGVAYFDAPVGAGGVAPLYCVSPGNTLRVVPSGVVGQPASQIAGSGSCGSTFLPEGRHGLRRLTLNFSIGQPF